MEHLGVGPKNQCLHKAELMELICDTVTLQSYSAEGAGGSKSFLVPDQMEENVFGKRAGPIA